MAHAGSSSTTQALSTGWREFALLFLLASIWSSSFMFIKVGVDTIPPMTLSAGRLVLAAIMLTVFAMYGRDSVPMTLKIWGVCLFIGLFGNALPYTLISWGELRIESGLAAILMGIVPITTAVLAHLFAHDEPLTVRRLLGICVGFAGIIILVGWQSLTGLHTDVPYELAVLLGALCYAVTNIFVRRHVYIPGRVLAAGSTLAGAFIMLPMALAYERPWSLSPSLESLGAMVMLGLLPTAVAALIYLRLIKATGATFVSQVNYLVPVLGVVWGMALLAERPSWRALAALTLILLGIALVNRRRRTK
jgi:drug/metabolite transporter (DMT)-like permease